MSIVAVHGPNMMYGTGTGILVDDPNVQTTPDPANAMKFTFQVTSTRAAADFSWNFGPGATPPTAAGTKGPTVVTYNNPNTTVNVVMTVAAGAGTPAAGTYTEVVRTGPGAIPREVEGQEVAVRAPADGTVTDVRVAPDDEVQKGDIVATEATTAANGEYEEYDPGAHTVNEVVAEAEDANDPDYTQALIDAERAGKNRTTLISHLESLL